MSESRVHHRRRHASRTRCRIGHQIHLSGRFRLSFAEELRELLHARGCRFRVGHSREHRRPDSVGGATVD